jgi:hypothetical protein
MGNTAGGHRKKSERPIRSKGESGLEFCTWSRFYALNGAGDRILIFLEFPEQWLRSYGIFDGRSEYFFEFSLIFPETTATLDMESSVTSKFRKKL